MITRLRFKNWRSLRDVEIDDLQRINVFIGANSSGKTNILDALRFLQYAGTRGNQGVVGAVRYKWGGKDKVHTLGIPQDEPTQVEWSLQIPPDLPMLTWQLLMKFYESESPYLKYSNKIVLGIKDVIEDQTIDLPLQSIETRTFGSPSRLELDRRSAIINFASTYMTRRWQIFKELFTPQLVLPPGESDPGDLYVVEENGRNIVFMLDNMRSQRPDLYQQLEEDIVWLLSHVDKLETRHTEREMSLIIRERMHGGLEAPSISAGTARLISILTAIYALDMETSRVPSMSGQPEDWTMPFNEMPGLVVIEEPDTALNPGVLRNFVEQLRYYANGKYPRQFILTTHNPAFLDYFEPEEVRVVTRDEQGYTQVNRIPESVKKIWLDDEEHTLGEVWLTNSFGGLVE